MKKAGIIATVLTSLLCGLPGLALACFGLVGAIGSQLPGYTYSSGTGIQDTALGAAIFIGGGILLVLIPIVVGIVSAVSSRKNPPAPAAAAYSAPAPAVQPQALPARPAQPMQAAPPAAAPAAPAAPVQPAAAAVQPAPAPVQSAPSAGTEPVYARLMALNRPTAPYRIVDGRAENVDLIAEWKIVDAQWYEIFAKASLTKVFRIYLKLDPAKREVRAMDREYTVEWKAGVPSLSVAASFFQGQKSSVSFGMGYAFTETLAPGQVYKYKFNTNEIKKPIQEAVAASGWTYKGVAFGKL